MMINHGQVEPNPGVYTPYGIFHTRCKGPLQSDTGCPEPRPGSVSYTGRWRKLHPQ